MLPYISIVCQDEGHVVALEYAKLLSEAKIPIMVNFPNAEGYPVAPSPDSLLSSRTAALIIILTDDVFTTSGKSYPKFRIDLEVIRRLLEASTTPAKSRLFAVITDEGSAARIKGMWLSALQCVTDNAINREEMLTILHKLVNTGGIDIDISSFNNIESIISAMEPTSEIERVASERVGSDKISYEIFKCTHKFRRNIQYIIHLHRGITIVNTVNHIQQNYSDIMRSKGNMILLGVEKGQSRLEERISNIKIAFKCEDVFYLEDIASRLVADSIGSQSVGRTEMVRRKFVEPQVRRGIVQIIPPSDYSLITNWLCNTSPGILVLVGQGGIGKTWAMMDLRARITNRKLNFSKPISKRVIFISSTDVARGLARVSVSTEYITLYDLYCASCAAQDDEQSTADRLPRETFYDALELGSLVIFVDGLDEIITRHRARFSASFFFSDLAERLTSESDGKIVVSCRNIFFDQDEARFDFPYVETFEILGFDADRRSQFFQGALEGLPGRLSKALQLSDRLAALPNGLYVPFVLDLIKDLMLEQADVTQSHFENFQSNILISTDPNDRIIGQFCQREMLKVLDPIRELSIDHQVQIFCEIARRTAASRGRIDRAALAIIVNRVTNRKDADGFVDHLIAHPFISQEEFSKHGVVDFRFDFMPEYFLALDFLMGFEASRPLDDDDVRILNKYCSLNSAFCLALTNKISSKPSDFYFRLVEMHEQGVDVISNNFDKMESDILQPDSESAYFSFAIVSLIAGFQRSSGLLDAANFTSALREVFGIGSTLRRIALLDGIIHDDERIRLDFRGLRFEECLFHAVDIWSCQYDEQSSFSKCRFMNCSGVFAKSTGINLATFEADCHVDSEFEKEFAQGRDKIKSTEAQNVEAIRSFVSDFYRQGGFRRINLENIERFYGASNSVVRFKKLYNLMKRHGAIIEEDRGHYTDVRVAGGALQAAERLITQGVLGGVFGDVAKSLR